MNPPKCPTGCKAKKPTDRLGLRRWRRRRKEYVAFKKGEKQ